MMSTVFSRERDGSHGGTWRHIREVYHPSGDLGCFVDGEDGSELWYIAAIEAEQTNQYALHIVWYRESKSVRRRQTIDTTQWHFTLEHDRVARSGTQKRQRTAHWRRGNAMVRRETAQEVLACRGASEWAGDFLQYCSTDNMKMLLTIICTVSSTEPAAPSQGKADGPTWMQTQRLLRAQLQAAERARAEVAALVRDGRQQAPDEPAAHQVHVRLTGACFTIHTKQIRIMTGKFYAQYYFTTTCTYWWQSDTKELIKSSRNYVSYRVNRISNEMLHNNMHVHIHVVCHTIKQQSLMLPNFKRKLQILCF